jgi:hypothetical protein
VADETFFKSDVATKLPIIGDIVAVGKGIVIVRDRLFVRKVLRFLDETSSVSEDDKRKFREKLDSDPEAAIKAGAAILDLIDKATDAEKAAMMGKVMRAFMHEDDLATSEMIGLCEMIDKAYLSDLQALARPDDSLGPSWNDVNLEGVGIKKSMRSEDVNQAIQALTSRLTAQMPVIHEGPINTEAEPVVVESGFTDAGSNLRRILREY